MPGRLVALDRPSLGMARARGPTGLRFRAPPGLDTAALGSRRGWASHGARAGARALPRRGAPPARPRRPSGAWLAERGALLLTELRVGRQSLEEVYLRPDRRGRARPRGGAGAAPRDRAAGRSRRPTRKPAAPLLPAMLRAQTAIELRLTLRRGESVLVTVLLPALLLLFFSTVPSVVPPSPAVTARPPPPAQSPWSSPAVLALAVMSTAMVSLGIATAFERQYGVLKRLGASPLPSALLVWAKVLAVLAVEALQLVLLAAVALAPGVAPAGPAGAPPAVTRGAGPLAGDGGLRGSGCGWPAPGGPRPRWRGPTACTSSSSCWAGSWSPRRRSPGPLGPWPPCSPRGPWPAVLRGALAPGPGPSCPALLVLALWALATPLLRPAPSAGSSEPAPLLAARTFRWEYYERP